MLRTLSTEIIHLPQEKSLFQTTAAIVALAGNPTAVQKYSCPAEAVLTYTFADKVYMSLSWKDKDAGRFRRRALAQNGCRLENRIAGQ